MAGFFDFLMALFKPRRKKDTSVVVKNYISGNNNQNNSSYISSHNRKGSGSSKVSRPQKTSGNSQQHIKLQSVRLYSTGAKGKVYTDKFYKSINHNFGIEAILVNSTSQTQSVSLGHCIYDESGKTIIKGNCRPKIAPHSKLAQDIYVEAKTFAKLKNGKYKSQLWLNDTKVQKVFFTVANK